jgi:uncharacterized protein (UPF0332 family)
MTPEAGYLMDKAHKLLAEAAAMLGINLSEAAARTAYLAGFHAAQALISEKTGRSVKTHKGVHMELHRLTKDDPHFAPDLRSFLATTYSLKNTADYDAGPGSEISREQAREAIELAKRFVAYLDELLSAA